MKVALQPAPLGVTGLDDPRPGGANLLQLGLHLGLQPGMLKGQASGGNGDLDQVRLVPQFLMMDEHGIAGRVQAWSASARRAAAPG